MPSCRTAISSFARDLNVQLPQLLCETKGRRVGHQIDRRGRFRERDDLADRGFRRHEGDDPIEAERDATMWRRAHSSASRKNPKRMRASSSLMLSREKIRRCSVES